MCFTKISSNRLRLVVGMENTCEKEGGKRGFGAIQYVLPLFVGFVRGGPEGMGGLIPRAFFVSIAEFQGFAFACPYRHTHSVIVVRHMCTASAWKPACCCDAAPISNAVPYFPSCSSQDFVLQAVLSEHVTRTKMC